MSALAGRFTDEAPYAKKKNTKAAQKDSLAGASVQRIGVDAHFCMEDVLEPIDGHEVEPMALDSKRVPLVAQQRRREAETSLIDGGIRILWATMTSSRRLEAERPMHGNHRPGGVSTASRSVTPASEGAKLSLSALDCI